MIRKAGFSAFMLFLVCAFLASFPVHAQGEYTRFELGAQYSLIEETNSALQGFTLSGVGARFDWNFTRRLAFESQIDFFPQHTPPLLLIQGGQTLEAVLGIRAKVIQTRKLSVFGLVRPGLLHFSGVQVLANSPSIMYTNQSANYFVLNLGGGLEYYLSPRWALRADIEGNPYRIPAFYSPASGAVLPGKINDTTRLSLGVAYRPGALIENEAETKVPGNWEFGPLFSSVVLAREGPVNNVVTENGGGGYFSYRFYGVFYADGDLLYFPQHPTLAGPQTGGTLLQGLFGIKGGIRRNHFGIFGKVRPGLDSFSDVLTGVTSGSAGTATYSYARANNFVLDLGGIVEVYPNEHGTLRVEIGDTHLFYPTRDVDMDGTTEAVPGGKMQHSIQLMVGYGWRF
jgi:Outer membrane protein beta-barrel domain